VDGVKVSELVQVGGFLTSEVLLREDQQVTGVTADSRTVEPGSLFVCMPSASRDTHSFLPDVARAGAAAAVVHSSSALKYAAGLGLSAFWVEPRGSRFNFVIGHLCRAVLGDPSAHMRLIGVTGTNGKTTTAWILQQAFNALGRKAAYLGTLGYLGPVGLESGANTTPFPVELWNLLDRAKREGVTDFVLEASSHALQERRMAGVSLDAGIYLNLSQDHLDFHGSMEHYATAKKLLFTEWAGFSNKPFVGVINQDDERGAEWLRELPCRTFSFGGMDADLVAVPTKIAVDHVELGLQKGDEQREAVRIPLGGAFNAENGTAALATLVALGYSIDESAQALAQVKPSPGRFEPIENDKGFAVLVDYAHTPDALAQLLKTVRNLTEGKLITVFGCGGDRDRSKRPKMAEAASSLSDYVVVTSDNPRTEDPERIFADILSGMKGEHEVVVDRKKAIFSAIARATKGDVVVIAGKGHEDYQIIGRQKIHLDDREIAREAVK